jgi:hypothetical protein
MFKIAYGIYTNTRVGRWVHNSSIKKEPHHDYSEFKFELVPDEIVVYIVPYSSDNYGYIIHNYKLKEYVLVDPADPAMVTNVLTHFEIIGN